MCSQLFPLSPVSDQNIMGLVRNTLRKKETFHSLNDRHQHRDGLGLDGPETKVLT
jgi:hypothetical protein